MFLKFDSQQFKIKLTVGEMSSLSGELNITLIAREASFV